MSKSIDQALGSFAAFASAKLSDLMQAKAEFSRKFITSRAGLEAGASLFATGIAPDPKLNVVGVGIGELIDGTRPTGVAALKFFVRQKIDPKFLSKSDMLPKTVDGLPTDVEEVGLLLPQPAAKRKPKKAKPAAAAAMPNPQGRFRPIQPGSSVGFQFPNQPNVHMAGTFGALVLDSAGDKYILSNNHVLANERTTTDIGIPNGSPIFQPGLLDGGKVPQDKVAELSNAIPYDVNAGNEVDAAVAEVVSGVSAVPDVLHIGPPTGTTPATMDMVVHKFGRTTAYTTGRVISINTDVNVTFTAGTLVFQDQIIIRGLLPQQPFSQSGDSGSLILERATNKAVGLLFAGSATHTIANHIDVVLQRLKVKLA